MAPAWRPSCLRVGAEELCLQGSPSLLHGPWNQLTSVPPCCFSDLPNAHGLSVDWVSRNLFWTSYDTNKKQINVARLDGSFKNAVIQGLDKPHCLVVHPLHGYVWGLGASECHRGHT